MIREAIALTRPAFNLLIPRHLRRAAANADRFYGGPPFGSEPFVAPSVREGYRDLDGMDQAARVRARALMMRKQAAKLRRPLEDRS